MRIIYTHGTESANTEDEVKELRKLLPEWKIEVPSLPANPQQALEKLRQIQEETHPTSWSELMGRNAGSANLWAAPHHSQSHIQTKKKHNQETKLLVKIVIAYWNISLNPYLRGGKIHLWHILQFSRNDAMRSSVQTALQIQFWIQGRMCHPSINYQRHFVAL